MNARTDKARTQSRLVCRAPNHRETNVLQRAWADHLNGFAWDHAVTLTSRYPMSRVAIARAFTNKFVRRLSRRLQGPVPFFWIVEQATHGFPHLHALVSSTARLSVEEMQGLWSMGFTRIVTYDARRGAAFYTTKDIASPDRDDYGVSRRLPRRIAYVVEKRSSLASSTPRLRGP